QNGAGFVWESDVGRVGMVREARNGEIRGFSGVAGNTMLCIVFQTMKDMEGCTILKIFIFSPWGWGKLIQKLLLNQKCMGYLVRAYYSISPTRYYKDDSCWSADLKSKTTEDIISNRSFMEVLVPNHYVLVKKVFVLFTETECLVLSPGFKLLDENQVLLKVPRQNNMYSFDLKNVAPSKDHLGKFEGKADEGFLVGYSVNRRGPECLFDIDSLTISMNYEPVTTGNQTNHDVGKEIHDNAWQAGQEKTFDHEYILIPFMPLSTQSSDDKNANKVPSRGEKEFGIFDDVYDDREVGAEADINNLDLSTVVSPIPITRVHKDHPKEQIIDDAQEIPNEFYGGIIFLLRVAVKTTSTLMETHKASLKDKEAQDAYTYYCQMKVNAATHKLTIAGDGYRCWDGKKVFANEASIRRDLRLDDAKGTTCLPNVAIFDELVRMGAKTTTWNKFSSTMASAIICLANNHKFNFFKYILKNMVKNLEAEVKFFMFPGFIQVFMNHQLGDMSHHKWIFVNPSLTKKIFANIKRIGKGFSGEITPLFATMMRKHKTRRKQRKETEVPQEEPPTKEHIPTLSHDPLPSGEDRLQLNELIEICTKLSDNVLSLEQTKTNQATEIERVKKLEGKKKKRTHGLKRPYKGRMNEEDLFGVHDLSGDEVFVDVTTSENIEQDATVVEKEVSNADLVTTAGEVVTTAKNVKVAAAATTPQNSKDEFTRS
nr:ribonuclease H-like domain-containing protein [Tanacetum cinerariifolium]